MQFCPPNAYVFFFDNLRLNGSNYLKNVAYGSIAIVMMMITINNDYPEQIDSCKDYCNNFDFLFL